MEKQLPKHVAFKGDNGKYLAADTLEVDQDHVFLQFSVEPENRKDSRCSYTIRSNYDGTIRIKSDKNGKFWRLSPNWIWADSNSGTTYDTLFRPVKLDGGDGMYALLNVESGNYCHSLTADWKVDCLNASSKYLHREAHLELEEAVLSRRIYDVHYHTDRATIHDQKLVNLISQVAVNHGSRDLKETVALNYKITQEIKWDSTASVKFGVTLAIKAGLPVVESGSVEVSVEGI